MQEGKKERRRAFVLAFVITFSVMTVLVSIAVMTVQRSYIKGNSSETQVYIPRSEDAITVLVCGTDEQGKGTIFAIVGFYPVDGVMPVTVLPPETLVRKKDMTDTLSEVFFSGGGSMARMSVESTANIRIDRWVRLNREEFVDLMTALGPVDYEMPQQIEAEGIVFSKGVQQLDGGRAAAILLHKEAGETPIQRSTRRAQVISGIMNDRLAALGGSESHFKQARSIAQMDISLTDFLQRKRALDFVGKLAKRPAYPVEVQGKLNVAGNTFTLSKETVELLKETYS